MHSSQQRARVLIVDDEPHIVELLTEFLQDEFEVTTTLRPRHALDLLRSKPFDIIISDNRMPELTGAEFLTKSRSISPDSERILITAFADLDNAIQSVNEAKVSYYLTKPIESEQFRLVVRQAAEISRLRAHNSKLLVELQAANTRLEEKVAQRSAELKKANDELRELQKVREQMLHMAVHDLKSPISNIRLALQEIRREDISDTVAEFLELADMSGAALASIVRDMLTIATISSGKQLLHLSPVEPTELLNECVHAFMLAAKKKSINLSADIAVDLPVINAHPQKLREAIDNLVSNAIKYTPEGGNVIVQGTRNGASLGIAIRDTGLGLTADDIKDAFKEFKRLSARPTGNESSTGLGLYIVKKIVELHEGSVKIESDGPHKGTTVSITLPLAQSETSA